MKPCAIGFDFDHTLGVDHHLERRAFGLLAEELGAPIDVTAAARELDELMVLFRRAEEPMESMIGRFVARLPVPRGGERDSRRLAERYREICYSLVDGVTATDGAAECIAELVAADIPVGILTNGWSPLQERKIERALGSFPGPVLVSDSIAAYKPSSSAFHQLETALGCSETGLWYVGDNPEVDIAGAHAHGVRAVWFAPNGETYPPELPPPDARIQRLVDLVGIVRGASGSAAK